MTFLLYFLMSIEAQHDANEKALHRGLDQIGKVEDEGWRHAFIASAMHDFYELIRHRIDRGVYARGDDQRREGESTKKPAA